MRKLISLLFVVAFVPLFVITSCRKDEDPDPVDPVEKTEYEILTEYMTANTMDLSDVLTSWVTSGGGLTVDADFAVADYYIMDFRGDTDFDAGHIKDANNVVFADLLTHAATLNKTDKILCVCYTGQTAARATGLLRLAGYTNAKNLKWGMSGWHADLDDKWVANAGDYASPNWTTTGTPTAVAEFDDPLFVTGETDGAAILEARIQAAIALPWTVAKHTTENDGVLDTPDDYFINNYWPEASWTEYGHVSGAYRHNEDLGLATLNNLNPAETVVTYCYTGQTSAITTAWLHVLGFDTAKSLTYGANGIVHSDLLTGTAGDAPLKSWHGVGSGSTMNFGYYDSLGTYYPPL